MDGGRFKLDFWRECYAQFNSGDTSMLCFINSKLVSDCCLTPTQQLVRAISWREQVNFQWNDDEVQWREQVNFQWNDDEVRFVLDQHA